MFLVGGVKSGLKNIKSDLGLKMVFYFYVRIFLCCFFV